MITVIENDLLKKHSIRASQQIPLKVNYLHETSVISDIYATHTHTRNCDVVVVWKHSLHHERRIGDTIFRNHYNHYPNCRSHTHTDIQQPNQTKKNPWEYSVQAHDNII